VREEVRQLREISAVFAIAGSPENFFQNPGDRRVPTLREEHGYYCLQLMKSVFTPEKRLKIGLLTISGTWG